MTDRDHELAILAYDMADAMLRERDHTNHDAAPAARATNSGSASGTSGDSLPVTKPSSGTGDTSDRSKPVKDDVSDRSKPISDDRLAALEQLSALDQELELKHGITGNPMIKARPCKAADLEPTPPRNGALSGCETVPDPDSRVWETPRTPPPLATPPQGSVQGEGSVPDSRNAKEPVAWAVAGDNGDYAVKLCFDEASAVLEADRRCRVGLRPDYVAVPLYRQPQPTLTDEEREAVEWYAAYGAGHHADTLRKMLERLA